MSVAGRTAAVLLALCCMRIAAAGTVTVDVITTLGAPGEDTVLVFDPLDATPAPGHGTATIDQINKMYVPRVTVVRTGTTVTFPNSDNIRHQVYSFSKPNPFTLKLYSGSPATPIKFERPGLVVLGCNIHDRMVAFVAVVDSPYFTKTSASGRAVIDLPSGRYRLRVWHPSLSAPVATQQITVDRTALAVHVNTDIDLKTAAVAAWPE